MIQEIDIYIIFGLILVFLNTIFYFKKSGDIVENWFGSCGRDINRREDRRNTAKNNLSATGIILSSLKSKTEALDDSKELQDDYQETLGNYKDEAIVTLTNSIRDIDQSQLTNSFINDDFEKNVRLLSNVL